MTNMKSPDEFKPSELAEQITGAVIRGYEKGLKPEVISITVCDMLLHCWSCGQPMPIRESARQAERTGGEVESQLLNEVQAAAILAMPARRLLKLARQWLVPHVRLPDGEIRFDPEALTRWVAEHAHDASEAAPCKESARQAERTGGEVESQV